MYDCLKVPFLGIAIKYMYDSPSVRPRNRWSKYQFENSGDLFLVKERYFPDAFVFLAEYLGRSNGLWDRSSLACSAADAMKLLWRVVVLIDPLRRKVVEESVKHFFAPREPQQDSAPLRLLRIPSTHSTQQLLPTQAQAAKSRTCLKIPSHLR